MEVDCMKTDKIKIFVRQFGMLGAVRFVCAELARKLFDRYNTSSYSQTGEDRILGSIMTETGFYVDVGCNHPENFSNTFALYKKGWIGITIDANKELIHKHRRLRKQDTGICAVVSNKEQETVFTEFEDSLVSSLDADHIKEWQKKRKIKEQRTVNTVSLTRILEGCKVNHKFDLLCIDVEGHDFEVLSSLNFTIYRPKLIVIELHEFDFDNPSLNKTYEYLRINNYKMIGYVVINGYFIDVSPVA
jgi:FkbM family methyltransferase